MEVNINKKITVDLKMDSSGLCLIKVESIKLM